MMSAVKRSRQVWLLVLVLFVFCFLTACGGRGEAGNSSAVQVTLIPAPEGVNGQAITVQLAGADGQPLTDATVRLEGNMSHAGMVPVITEGVKDDADGAADGRYQVPFSFTMLGDWIITVSIQMPDGSTVQQDINVTVGEQGVAVRES
jgi:hypothetical protein